MKYFLISAEKRNLHQIKKKNLPTAIPYKDVFDERFGRNTVTYTASAGKKLPHIRNSTVFDFSGLFQPPLL